MVHLFLITIDTISEKLAMISKWLIAVLIVVICYEVFQRYALGKSLVWVYEVSFMLGGLVIVFGQGYVMKVKGHARVDVLFEKFSKRKQYLLDILFNIFLFLPSYALLTNALWVDFLYSFQSGEKSIVSTWYPLLWPLKLCIFIGFVVMVLQLIAEIIKDIGKYRSLKGEQQ